MSERTAIYRLFDRSGTLLYVGVSSHPKRRFVDHRRTQPWWGEVCRREVGPWYPTREDAAEAERMAIRAENPRYNVRRAQGNTPIRNFRVADEIWLPALANAVAEDRSLTDVIVAGLREYISSPPRSPAQSA